jgi:hypothetical protein
MQGMFVEGKLGSTKDRRCLIWTVAQIGEVARTTKATQRRKTLFVIIARIGYSLSCGCDLESQVGYQRRS